jgi:hypothetical protein
MTDGKRPRGRPLVERLGAALQRTADAAAERPEDTVAVPRGALTARSRRDFLLFGAGVLATAARAPRDEPERRAFV